MFGRAHLILFFVGRGIDRRLDVAACTRPRRRQGRPEISADIKEKIEELKRLAQTKSWTFQIGVNKVSGLSLQNLCGTVIPPAAEVRGISRPRQSAGRNGSRPITRRQRNSTRRIRGSCPGPQMKRARNPPACPAKSAFNWRDLGKVTDVRDQGSCGSCWDFAAIGTLECNHLIRNNEKIDAAEQHILDCSGAGNCPNGGWHHKAFEFMVSRGVCQETAYPYNGKDGSCKNVTSPYKAVSLGASCIKEAARRPWRNSKMPYASMVRLPSASMPLPHSSITRGAYSTRRSGKHQSFGASGRLG